jgi:hypothetical protein
MQFIEKQLVRNEQSTIPYTYISNGNKGICIMLPGIGYTTQRPLFHYATGLFINQNFDILHINYDYRKNDEFNRLGSSERERWIYEDVKAVLDEVCEGYEKLFILGKSLGTIPMAMELTHKPSAKIWLTPLLKDDGVYQALLNTDVPSLCMIGDEDHHYIEEKLTAIKSNHLVSTVVIPKADHSLELQGDHYGSIDAVKRVMQLVEEFIKKTKI